MPSVIRLERISADRQRYPKLQNLLLNTEETVADQQGIVLTVKTLSYTPTCLPSVALFLTNDILKNWVTERQKNVASSTTNYISQVDLNT